MLLPLNNTVMQKINSTLILLSGSLLASQFIACNQQNKLKETESTEYKMPNIVFVLADDLGWTDVSYNGSQYYETPNIDALAKSGMIFTNAYANAPNCAPSRACLLTGQYTPRHGVFTVGSSERGESRLRKLIPVKNTDTLATEKITIAEILSEYGYKTISIGKWHMGESPQTSPEAQGFDINIAGNHSGMPSSYFSPYNNPNLPDGPKGEYLTDRLTDYALDFIEDNKNQPFFVYLSHYAVHTPIEAKEKLIKKYENKPADNGHTNPVYAAMIESLDQSVGRVMKKLDSLKLRKNTIFIFFSDNGGHGKITDNAPLRGSKGMLYEGGIRVPLIVSWPENVKPGTKSDVPVIGIDFFPTFLEAARLGYPEKLNLDGVSLMPVLLQEEHHLQNRPLIWHFPAYLQAYGKDKGFRTTPAAAIRIGNYKLIEFFENERIELYDLSKDLSEKNNIRNKNTEKALELYEALINWREQTNAPVPSQLNPEYNP